MNDNSFDTRCMKRVRKSVTFDKSLVETLDIFFPTMYASFLIKIKQDIFLCLIVTFFMCLNQELHEIQDI